MARKKSPQHSRSGIALLVSSAVIIVITVVFNGFSNIDIIPGLFVKSLSAPSDYYLNIRPAAWTFSVWGLIYIQQFLFVGYSLSLLCRRGPDNYLYLSPPEMIPSPAYWAYSIANLGNIAWLFLWDRELFVASGILLALMAFLLMMAIGFALRGLNATTPALTDSGLSREIWFNRVFVHNGLATYATWLCIATLLNFSQILLVVLGMPQDISGTFSLCILAGEVVIWFLLDVSVLAPFTNYMITPYIVVIFALTGIIVRNFVAWETNSLFSVILIIVAVASFIVKLISMWYRHRASSKDTDSITSSEA